MLEERPDGRGIIGELASSAVAAALLPLSCLHVKVDPMDRVGQVSGLAAIELRFMLAVIVIVVALAIAARVREGRAFGMTSRLACAALAGLASGVVAAGIVIALRGTHYGLNGLEGDSGRIVDSAQALQRGEYVPLSYPPLPLYGLAWYSDLVGVNAAFALKHLQIIGTAALGPATYLAWRLLLRPGWALGIGLVAALPLIDASPYKPYSFIVLLVFIPATVKFLDVLRTCDQRDVLSIARLGVLFGAAFGVLCLLYAGWFKWSAPGLIVAGAIVFPWRRAPRRGALLVGLVAVMFALIAGTYIVAVLSDVSVLDDKFIYFDALTEPTYIAMFGGDLPVSEAWPPLGELGGVGVFTVLMTAGVGAAIAWGRERTEVIALGCVIAGLWLVRFWYAHLMFQTKLVQLYPRTTPELLYCALLLCGLALFYIAQRFGSRAAPDSPLRAPSGMIGTICALSLLFGSAGSLIANRYMPNNYKQMSFGILAWNSHNLKAAMPTPLPFVKK